MKNYLHAEYLKKILSTTTDELVDKIYSGNDKVGVVLKLIMGSQKEHVKDQLLSLNEDTILNDADAKYLKAATKLGFYKILEYPFNGYYNHELTKEYLYGLFNADLGIFLKIETHRNRKVKKASMFYNWTPNTHEYIEGVMDEGHFVDNVWVGKNDCREALILKMCLLKENGTFYAPWVANPEMDLFHYLDKKKNGAVNEQRFGFITDKAFLSFWNVEKKS